MMKETNEYQRLILSALLHDIGKFYQRTGSKLEPEDDYWITVCCKKLDKYGYRYSHQHAVYSKKFINKYLKGYEDVEDIAAFHHVPENAPDHSKRYFAKLITLADWLSSGERREKEREEEVSDPSQEALVSVFSDISLGADKEKRYYVPLKPLDAALEGMFPVSSKEEAFLHKEGKEAYRSLWEDFTEEVTKIGDRDILNQLLFLMEKYTLCVPASTYKDRPDLSLFHHSKSVAAIAACLYHLKLPEEKIDSILHSIRGKAIESDLMKETGFLFVGGDISGIQDFIYSVTSEKALKGLRGRSLYLQLLSETIAKMILKDFHLPDANLIYSGGGHFYLLLPFSEQAKNRLYELQKEIDKILLSAHKGKLAVLLSFHPVSWRDFMNFAEVWTKLATNLTMKKKRKFSDIFSIDENFVLIFGPSDIGGEFKACEICGEEIEEGEQCRFCTSFAELSSSLAKARSVSIIPKSHEAVRTKPSSWLEVLESLGFFCRFLEKEDRAAYVINSTDFAGRSLGYRFIARTTPMRNGEVMTLEEIADTSRGTKKWGVLRADVDNLGTIFREALGEDRTISRLSMFSYMLSLFFSARVDTIAKDFSDRVCVVYSGGDDLFILGAWSELCDIAKRIYNEFRRFTCHNLTMSAGIYIAPSKKFPVYEAAIEAGRAVESAKEKGKDRITFLDTPLTWKELEDAVKVVEHIRSLLEDHGIRSVPRSLLSILYAGWREKEMAQRNEIPMPRIWRFFYFFKRIMRGYAEKDVQLLKLNELLKKVVTDYELMPHLNMVTRWADYLTRKEV